MKGWAAEGLVSPWVDWDLGLADCIEDTACIGGCLLERCVSMDRGDAQEIEGRVMGCN